MYVTFGKFNKEEEWMNVNAHLHGAKACLQASNEQTQPTILPCESTVDCWLLLVCCVPKAPQNSVLTPTVSHHGSKFVWSPAQVFMHACMHAVMGPDINSLEWLYEKRRRKFWTWTVRGDVMMLVMNSEREREKNLYRVELLKGFNGDRGD